MNGTRGRGRTSHLPPPASPGIERREAMRVSGLLIYPVKSLRGISVTRVRLDELGPEGDRRFMVVDAGGRFLTQRTLPRMALIATGLTPETLVLTYPGAESFRLPLSSCATVALRSVSVWSSDALDAEDCGDPVAAWLTGILGQPCRLVRAGARFHRPIVRASRGGDDVLAFADASPLLVVSEASLANLNDRLIATGEESVPMNRFRPNLVISDSSPFAEDSWSRIRIGNVIMRAAGPCARCVVTTTDQLTAMRGPEPLRMLATFRRDTNDSTKVNFGQNFIHETKSGTVQVGAPVEVLA